MPTKKPTNAELAAKVAELEARLAAEPEDDEVYDEGEEEFDAADDDYDDSEDSLEDDDLDEDEVEFDDGVVVRMPLNNAKLGIKPVEVGGPSIDPANLPDSERVHLFTIRGERFYGPAEPGIGIWMAYLGQRADGDEGMAEVVLLREVLGVRGWRVLCRQNEAVIKAVTNRVMQLFPDSKQAGANRPNRKQRRSSGRGRSRR